MSIGSPLPRVPAFEDFYGAVNYGRRPFPWQARLAEQVRAEGRWPVEIGIPTGLGKTSCLDVAVWWLAAEADREPQDRRAPTRIWWVVNRRLLVDTTAEHADRIARLLRESAIGRVEAGHPAVESVARRLQHLTAGSAGEPLQIEQLRGGVALGRPRDPAQPSIILSTVPMFGSRLLFRGYGSSRSMRPIDAALAGTDSLVLIDEAHLATHLMRLVPALRECAPTGVPVLPAQRSWPQVVSLTATGDVDADRFELDDEDRSHSVVQERLSAHKRLEIRKNSKSRLAEELAGVTLDLLRDAGRATSCVVFANTPADARQVFMRIKRQQDRFGLDALLLTGRSRECDAEDVRARVVDPDVGAPSGHNPKREKSLVVVATQTLEVGADVDFEFLVTEQCGTRALIQRLGRLNRLGRYSNSQAIYVHLPAPTRKGTDLDGWPVYGREPETVLERLECTQGLDGDVDVSPQLVRDILGAPSEHFGRAPEILPALLWEWIKTTTPPSGEAPVEPYFSGVADPDRSASVMWRCHVPPGGHRLWPRPRDTETVGIPLRELRDELEGDELVRLDSDGVTVEATTASRLRPGDIVVLPTDRGLLDEFGWSPESREMVADVSLAASGLPLDATALRRCCGIDVADEVRRVLQEDAEEPDDDERAEAAKDLIEALKACSPPHCGADEWHGFLDRLDTVPVDAEGEVSRLVLDEADGTVLYDEFDEVSLAGDRAAVELELHGHAVGERARQVAAVLGVEADAASMVGRAAALHDVGKADERFQRWLSDGEPSRPALAKSRLSRSRWAEARAAAGWPRGGRHEELSARLVRNWLQCQAPTRDEQLDELLIHLVVSHHGRGRPFVLPVRDGTSSPVRCEIDGVTATACADLSVADWEQPERFARLNRRYGPWGLALLEAIVRQADHIVSAGGDVR